MRKKILFILREMACGGSGRCISIFSKVLVEYGYDVSILIIRNYDDEYYIDSNVKVVRLSLIENCDKVKKKALIQKVLPFLKNEIKKILPDIIIPFGVDMSVMTILVTLMSKQKVCATVRSNPKNEPKSILFRFVRNLFYGFSPYIWVQTAEQKLYFPKSMHKRIFIIPNPINQKYLDNDCNNMPKMELKKFVTLGRMVSQKNHKMLINAFALLVKEFENVTLKIYGNGNQKDELQKLIFDKNLQNCIFLCERTNNVIKVLEENDIFVLSSNFEGLPNALMEAMALGKPCISTDCPTGPNDLIVNGVNGLLSKVNDCNELYENMKNMIDNPLNAYSMGKLARKSILKKYNEINITKILIEKLEQI